MTMQMFNFPRLGFLNMLLGNTQILEFYYNGLSGAWKYFIYMKEGIHYSAKCSTMGNLE